MSTADDASTLRRRRPPVVRINLEPNEDASDSAQSSPRAASDSSGAGPQAPQFGKARTARGRRVVAARAVGRRLVAAVVLGLRVGVPRGRASPSPLESSRSVVEPPTHRPPIEEDEEEDDDALAVASLSSAPLTRWYAARGLRRRTGAAGGESGRTPLAWRERAENFQNDD